MGNNIETTDKRWHDLSFPYGSKIGPGYVIWCPTYLLKVKGTLNWLASRFEKAKSVQSFSFNRKSIVYSKLKVQFFPNQNSSMPVYVSLKIKRKLCWSFWWKILKHFSAKQAFPSFLQQHGTTTFCKLLEIYAKKISIPVIMWVLWAQNSRFF